MPFIERRSLEPKLKKSAAVVFWSVSKITPPQPHDDDHSLYRNRAARGNQRAPIRCPCPSFPLQSRRRRWSRRRRRRRREKWSPSGRGGRRLVGSRAVAAAGEKPKPGRDCIYETGINSRSFSESISNPDLAPRITKRASLNPFPPNPHPR